MDRSMRNRLVVGLSLFVIGVLGYFEVYSVFGEDSRSLGSVLFEALGEGIGSVQRAATIIGGVGAILCVLVVVQLILNWRKEDEPEPKKKKKSKSKK